MPRPPGPAAIAAALAAILAAALAGCTPGALATSPGDADAPVASSVPVGSPAPSASGPSTPAPSAPEPSTPAPAPTVDHGAGPDPVASTLAPPTPTTCADVAASPYAERWSDAGFVLEEFDGIVVGGAFAPATDAGATLAVHCILWTTEGAYGPHVLVELYRGADPAAVLAHPSLAAYGTAPLATAVGDVLLADSTGLGIASSQETVGGHGDVVLRTFTTGMPLDEPPGITGPHAVALLFAGVFGSAEP